MAKSNFFGDRYHGPEDAPEDFVEYAEAKGAGGFYGARVTYQDDPDWLWCADVDMNEASGEVSLYGFASKEAITEFLIDAGVPADDIEYEDIA